MASKTLPTLINITSPCDADWNSMIGNDRIRFCEHCQLSVHTVDLNSKKQVRRLLARSKGRLCVRSVERRAVAATFQPLYKIGRRASALAAGAFSAALGFTNVAANTSTAVSFRRDAPTLNATQLGYSSVSKIRGTIFDPKGAGIPGATVTLSSPQKGTVIRIFSGGSGEYSFERLEPGSYDLSIAAAGFESRNVPNITVRVDDDTRIDQTLGIAPITAEVTVNAGETVYATAGGGSVVIPVEPVVRAAYRDDLESLQLLLLNTPNVDIRDRNTDYNALECAVMNANREMTQVLIWAKADVNARDREGRTPLMVLGEKATAELVMDLLNAGAKVNVRDNDGDTPLIEAAGVDNLDLLRTLIDAGAKVDAHNNEGKTALMIAASSNLVNSVRALVMAGANINARDKEGKSALRFAMEEGHVATVRLLRSLGAIEFEIVKDEK
jgi:hypothetical protein